MSSPTHRDGVRGHARSAGVGCGRCGSSTLPRLLMTTRPFKTIGSKLWRAMSLRTKVFTRRSEGRRPPTHGVVPWLLGQKAWLVVPDGSPMKWAIERLTPRARLRVIRTKGARDPLLVSRLQQGMRAPRRS